MKRSNKKNVNPNRFVGMGIDIVDIPRFRKTLSARGSRFINRVFLPSEKKYCGAKLNPWIHYAGRFAAKEAIAKAFGTGIGGKIGWLDIEVAPSEAKRPFVKFSSHGLRLMRRYGVKNVLISISHTHAHSVAVALLTA